MSVDKEVFLKSIYFNPKSPASFSSPENIYREAHKSGRTDITRSDVQNWLTKQPVYSIFRSAKRKFKTGGIVVDSISMLHDLDFLELPNMAEENDGVKFVLLTIDLFSRKVWGSPVKRKISSQVIEAMTDLIDQGANFKLIRSDRDIAFKSKIFQAFLKEHNIGHYFATGRTKANYIESVIKTIEGRIFRYLEASTSDRYIDVLQDIISAYNSSEHRQIRMPPNAVKEENWAEVFSNQYLLPEIKRPKSIKKKKIKKRFKFQIGDVVRLSRLPSTFERSYNMKFTRETFKILARFRRGGQAVYQVEDEKGEKIEGMMYESEMVKITPDPDQYHEIEKILKTKKLKNGETMHFVKWLNFPKKYNEWVSDSQTTKDWATI
jgi:hypothetical protein